MISLLWMAGQLEEGNDAFFIYIIKQVQGYDLVVIGKLNYPDICRNPYSAESEALINSSIALMRLCFPRR